MSETLTLDAILASPNLRQLGAMAGDEVVNNKLVRKFSSEEDRVDLGEKLSDEDIQNSPNLQKLGASRGDRIVDNKLIKTETDSAIQQFKYGYDSQNNFIGYGADALRAVVPFGELDISFDKGIEYQTPDEAFGPGFTQADQDQRREMILRARERNLQEEYGPYFDSEDGTAKAIGEVTGAIADPTSLIPLGASIKGALAIGGALGGGYSALEDMATKGEVDPAKAALFTATGAVGGGALKGLSIGVGKLADNRRISTANRIIDGAERRMNLDIASGISREGAFRNLYESDLSGAVSRAVGVTGRTGRVPSSPSIAQRNLDNAIANDSAISRLKIPGLDKFLGTLSTRIGNISQPILGAMRKFELNTLTGTHKALQSVSPFLKQFRQLPAIQRNQISTHLFNGETNRATALMPEQMQEAFTPVRATLDNIYSELKDSGLEIGKVDNYFPRIVKDYDGLRRSFGLQDNTELDRLMDTYAKKQGLPGAANLDHDEKVMITNRWLRGFTKPDGKISNAKERKIDKLTPEQVDKFYHTPEDSLSMYIRNAVNSAERNKFFGRYAKKKGDLYSVRSTRDIDQSIGEVVEAESPNLTAEQKIELKNLLESRFKGGEQSPGKVTGTLRDFGYLGTIANPISAITQLGDLGASMALNGFRNTIASMFSTKNVKMLDIGLSDIQQELAEGNARSTAKLLNKLFTISGFRAIDRLGKETYMNAAFRKNKKLVRTQRGEAKFRQKWGKLYGPDVDGIIDDLRSGRVTENVKLHAFNELSGIQPITMLEMPQAYLDNPNGRILYMLKTFMLKQLDVVRRNVVQEWNQGSKLKATKNAGLLAGYLSAANVGTQTAKDMLLGRDVDPAQIPNDAVWALTGVYGINKYTTDRYFARGQFKEGVMNMIAPATPVIDAALKVGIAPFQEDPKLAPLLRAVPLVGPMIYNWFGGGAEKFNERKAKED